MALPKIDVPIFNLELPVTKKKLTFRPFLVKEEKILLMAVESGDRRDIIQAIKQIINNCVVDDLNVDDLPVADLEYVFINLRARSVGEEVELQYKCNNDIEGVKCGNLVKIKLNLLDVKPTIPEGFSDKIKLSESLGMCLKAPTFGIYDEIDLTKNEITVLIDLLSKCINYVYDENEIYYIKDYSAEEINEFIEGLSKDNFKEVEKFFKNIPVMKTKIDFICPKCGYKETMEVEGIQNFFY